MQNQDNISGQGLHAALANQQYGNAAAGMPNMQFVQRAIMNIAAFREVINTAIHCLSIEQTQDYLLALAHAPEVVMLETEPTKFIRRNINALSGLDSWTCAHGAALRVSVYWKERFSLFASKAISRMTTTDEAHMLMEPERNLLRAGLCMYIPKGPNHVEFLIDLNVACNLHPFTSDADSFDRCLFYQLTLGAIHDADFSVIAELNIRYTQKEEDSHAASMLLQSYVQRISRLLLYMPINVTVINLLTRSSPTSAAYQTPWIGVAFHCFDPSLLRIVQVEPYELAVMMNRNNMHRAPGELPMMNQNLPPFLAGFIQGQQVNVNLGNNALLNNGLPMQLPAESLWNHYQMFRQNQESHAMANAAVSAFASLAQPNESNSEDQAMFNTQNTTQADSKGSNPPITEQERLAKLRERNAMYSQRLYHKRKIELEVLESQVSRLNNESTQLQDENDRLFKLLREAKDIVHSSTKSDKDDSDCAGSQGSNVN
jgi:hypothetical protein